LLGTNAPAYLSAVSDEGLKFNGIVTWRSKMDLTDDSLERNLWPNF
jgi:hypothetical protein